MTKRIELDINSGVAEVKLNRPEKHNALDHAMFESLIDVGEKLARDRSIRAVILYGAGKSFCAGIDLSIFSGESSSDDFMSTSGYRTSRTGFTIGTEFEQMNDLFINIELSNFYEDLETSSSASSIVKKQEGN